MEKETERKISCLERDIDELKKKVWRLENPIKYKIGQRVSWDKHEEYYGLGSMSHVPSGDGVVSELPRDNSLFYKITCDGFNVAVMEHRLRIKK